MLSQLDMNTESIDTLIARVSSLETKEKELESAMGTISEGLERIEKKLGKLIIRKNIIQYKILSAQMVQLYEN